MAHARHITTERGLLPTALLTRMCEGALSTCHVLQLLQIASASSMLQGATVSRR